MDETLKELFRNNFAPDLLITMFSREDGTISVELVKKAIQEELRATDHMTFSSFFVEKVIKTAANLYSKSTVSLFREHVVLNLYSIHLAIQ